MFESIFFSWKLLIFNRGPTSARHRYVPDMATSTKAVSAAKVRQKTGRCQKVRAGFDHGVPWESFIDEAEREVGTSTPRMSGRGRTGDMIEPVRQAKKKKSRSDGCPRNGNRTRIPPDLFHPRISLASQPLKPNRLVRTNFWGRTWRCRVQPATMTESTRLTYESLR